MPTGIDMPITDRTAQKVGQSAYQETLDLCGIPGDRLPNMRRQFRRDNFIAIQMQNPIVWFQLGVLLRPVPLPGVVLKRVLYRLAAKRFGDRDRSVGTERVDNKDARGQIATGVNDLR